MAFFFSSRLKVMLKMPLPVPMSMSMLSPYF
jgi:hypothetical protein